MAKSHPIKNVILDLDESILSSIEAVEYNHKRDGDKANKFKHHFMDDIYVTFERPHVQEWLDYLFANFNVAVWTAATPDYAYWIVNELILKNHPERHLDFVFHSEHTKMSRSMRKKPKDLTLLWEVYKVPGYLPTNCVLIDDNKEVFRNQRKYVIPCPSFNFFDEGSESDTYLLMLMDVFRSYDKVKKKKHKLSHKRKLNL